MVILFTKLRDLIPRFDRVKVDQIPVWNEAPIWWKNGEVDIKLVKIIAEKGIGSIIEIAEDKNSPFFNVFHPLNPRVLIMTEKMMLNPFVSILFIDEDRCLTKDILRDRMIAYVDFLESIVNED